METQAAVNLLTEAGFEYGAAQYAVASIAQKAPDKTLGEFIAMARQHCNSTCDFYRFLAPFNFISGTTKHAILRLTQFSDAYPNGIEDGR